MKAAAGGANTPGPFRLNEGNVRNHTTARLDSLVRRSAGKRLTYKDLKNA
jgi:hypothetical protein